MPPKRTLTKEEKNAKAEKQRERRRNETPDVREKRLAEQREYQREKRRRMNQMVNDGRAAQAILDPPVQESLAQRNEDAAERRQEIDGLRTIEEESMEADQRQEMNRLGDLLEMATEVQNDDTQPTVEIVPVETETERAYREEFLNELRQQTRHNRRTIRTHRKAQEPVLFEANIPTHDCGRMDVKCGDCNALHFKNKMSRDKQFFNCCNKVSLPADLKKCPKLLESLLTDSLPQAQNLVKKIRNYNSALAFAPMGANVSLPPGRGPYSFRIHCMV